MILEGRFALSFGGLVQISRDVHLRLKFVCVGGLLFVYSVLDDLEGNSRRKH